MAPQPLAVGRLQLAGGEALGARLVLGDDPPLEPGLRQRPQGRADDVLVRQDQPLQPPAPDQLGEKVGKFAVIK